MNCLAENSDVKANSPWGFLFFIYSFFLTEFCRFDVRYNNISVSISSSESDSELRAMNSAIADFARLQETTSQYALTLSRSVSCAASPCPALRPPASQCAPGLKLASVLTPILLTWRIWWAPNNASKWQMGFNSAFKGLNRCCYCRGGLNRACALSLRPRKFWSCGTAVDQWWQQDDGELGDIRHVSSRHCVPQ